METNQYTHICELLTDQGYIEHPEQYADGLEDAFTALISQLPANNTGETADDYASSIDNHLHGWYCPIEDLIAFAKVGLIDLTFIDGITNIPNTKPLQTLMQTTQPANK